MKQFQLTALTDKATNWQHIKKKIIRRKKLFISNLSK